MTPDDLKVFRSRWGLSLRALAERIGYDHSTIALWESGKRPIPRRVGILLAAVERDLHDEKRPRSEE